MISLIHPSRQRAKKSFKTISKWIESAKGEIEIIIGLDNDDPEKEAYKRLYSDQFLHIDCHTAIVKLIIGDNKNAVSAINLAARFSKGDILIVVSDDTDCFEGWDEAIKKMVEGKKDWILKCNDGGIQSWIITMPVMDRAYYERFGTIYHPGYSHMFCDTELTAVADLLERKIECDLKFPHLHYSVTRQPSDVINDKANMTWAQGEELFLKRYLNNFDLIDPPGKITNEQYLNWIASKISI